MAQAQVGTRFGQPVSAGRPIASAGNVRQAMPGGDFIPDHCQGLTKAGHACTAKPVKGTVLCYGHGRSSVGDA